MSSFITQILMLIPARQLQFYLLYIDPSRSQLIFVLLNNAAALKVIN